MNPHRSRCSDTRTSAGSRGQVSTSTTTYALCVYDRTAGEPDLVASYVVPPNEALWSTKATSIKYSDKAGINDGSWHMLTCTFDTNSGQLTSYLDAVQVAQWDEEFHSALVAAAGNGEMARIHRDVTDRIRIIRRLDFTMQRRIDATYDEHSKILKAIRANRGDQAAMLLRAHIETSQAEVRKITLHQVHVARHAAS